MQTQAVVIDQQQAVLNVWRNAQRSASCDLSPIHFAHANGFTAGTYQLMLAELARDRDVYALNHRATWLSSPRHPAKSFGWDSAAKDMIAGLEQIQAIHGQTQGRGSVSKFVGVGHSLGAATTLLAAAKRPDLFEKIVLIEPILYPQASLWLLKMMPFGARHRFLNLPKKTLLRQDVWGSREDFVQFHATKSAFRGVPLEVMQQYALHGLRPRLVGNGFELVFPKTWEAHVFSTLPDVWQAIRRLKVPCVCLRASDSARWVPPSSWDKWQRLRPDLPLVTLEGMGHLAPLQKPLLLAHIIAAQMAQLG